jgi:branched-subunit amino acid aminotransferase/4-amino-4-deoxychorismate lyase
MHDLQPTALLDGRRMPLGDARLPVTDDGVARGDGAFETVGVWGGRPFALAAHLRRLDASLRAVGLPPPPLALLREEAESLCEGLVGDAVLRLYVTASGTRLLTLDRQPVRPAPVHLVPQPAPWIRPLDEYGPAGAKTMSYLPNMAATRAARRAGGDDALLLSSEGYVLEGPTFAVCWARDGRLHAPDVGLGIVDSISRRSVLALARERGVDVVEGRWPLEALEDAEEVLVSSSVRDVIAVHRVGARRLPEGPTPLRDALAEAFAAARRTGRGPSDRP